MFGSFSDQAKPAKEVITGFGVGLSGIDSKNHHSPTVSACEPLREVIELGLSRGRDALAMVSGIVKQRKKNPQRIRPIN